MVSSCPDQSNIQDSSKRPPCVSWFNREILSGSLEIYKPSINQIYGSMIVYVYKVDKHTINQLFGKKHGFWTKDFLTRVKQEQNLRNLPALVSSRMTKTLRYSTGLDRCCIALSDDSCTRFLQSEILKTEAEESFFSPFHVEVDMEESLVVPIHSISRVRWDELRWWPGVLKLTAT